MKEKEVRPVKLKQKHRFLSADTETPISLYLKLGSREDGILLESAEVDGRWGRYSLLATSMCFYIKCENGKFAIDVRDQKFHEFHKLNGLPFMDGLRQLLQNLYIEHDKNVHVMPAITRALYGYFGFGMISVFNPHLAKKIPIQEADCLLGFPANIYIFDHLYNRLCHLTINDMAPIPDINIKAEDNEPRIDMSLITSIPSADGYKEFVKKICNKLHQGEAIQVVPSTRFSVPFSGNSFTLYRRLRRLNPSPYMFYMKFPDITLFGSSPEIMVRCSENRLLLAPIAGTRKRGKDDNEDQILAKELLADPKERAEHVMLVDLGRNDLGRIAEPNTVNVDKYMEVERFSHVMHLTSKVTAILDTKDQKLDALDVLASTFPAGTVSGAPKMRALEIIRELEKQSRGPYAGCIGWIGLDKESVNLDMGITIRSMWIKNGNLHWQAGGGIVHDSDPEMEWQEVMNKSAIMRLVLKNEGDNYVPFNR